MPQKINQSKMIEVLRQLVASEGSQTAAARVLGISTAYMSDLLNGRRDVSENVAERLGYRRVVLFIAVDEKGTEK